MVSFGEKHGAFLRPRLKRLQDVQDEIYRQLQLLIPQDVTLFDEFTSRVAGSPLLRMDVLERHPYTHFLRLTYFFEHGQGEEFAPEPEFVSPDGRRVVRKSKIVARDYFNQIQHVELIYYITHPDGRSERLVHAFPMRYIYRFEAEHLLVRCGFEVQELYADYDKNPYGSKYPGELVFVASKVSEEVI